MARSFLVGISLFISLCATPAAQDLYQRQAQVQLAVIARDVLGLGWSLTHDVVTGSLFDRGRDTIRLSLRGGRAYAATATCDEDCSDIDLELIDPWGHVVSRDFRPDEVPVVTVTPRTDGAYRVRVIIARCSQEPCLYALGVFGE
jgi:hypothetical protein